MPRSTSESSTREVLLARRTALMAQVGMLDEEFDAYGTVHRPTESEWAAFEELEQIERLLDADMWFTREDIDPGRPEQPQILGIAG